jgi:hypothetical protein
MDIYYGSGDEKISMSMLNKYLIFLLEENKIQLGWYGNVKNFSISNIRASNDIFYITLEFYENYVRSNPSLNPKFYKEAKIRKVEFDEYLILHRDELIEIIL